MTVKTAHIRHKTVCESGCEAPIEEDAYQGDAAAILDQLPLWLTNPGRGTGAPKTVINMVLGTQGEHVSEFLEHTPWAEPLTSAIFTTDNSNAARQKRVRARKKFVALFCRELPVSDLYQRKMPPEQPCNWCHELYQPLTQRARFCSPGCRNAHFNFWKRERQRWKEAGGFTMPLFEESKKRMWASMDRTRRHRATYWRNRFEREGQQHRRFPDW